MDYANEYKFATDDSNFAATDYNNNNDFDEDMSSGSSSPHGANTFATGAASDIFDDGSKWEASTDINTGRRCYYNMQTTACVWEKPQAMIDFEQKKIDNSWQFQTDMNGRTYYYNATSGAAQYDRPLALGPSLNSLWSVHKTTDNATYFFNKVTGVATYEKPYDF